MPLYRRTARRGFSNHRFKTVYQPVSLAVISAAYKDGDVVSLESLKEKGIVKGASVQVKILNNGDIDKKVTIQGLAMSASAAEKVQKAGGAVQA